MDKKITDALKKAESKLLGAIDKLPAIYDYDYAGGSDAYVHQQKAAEMVRDQFVRLSNSLAAALALSATPVVGGGGESDLEDMVSRSALHVREAEIERNCLALSELPGMRDLAELVAEADPQELQTELDLYVREASKALYAALRSLASPAPLVAAGAGQWVKCDGSADDQMTEEWTWIALPDGTVIQGTWAEYWSDGMLDSGWAWHAGGVDDMCLLDPQPTHFQPKPAAPQPEATPRHA